MKVLLINPPTENMITTNLPSYVDEERGYNPPLGLMYVAAYAKQNTEHKIEIIDMVAEEISIEQLKARLRNGKPDVVGITTTTFTLIDAITVAKAVKETNKETKVVLGGIHTYIYPKETVKLPEIDFIICGEGEKPFTNLLENINNSKSIISGELVEDLDALPFPDRHAVKAEKYNSLLAGGVSTTMITSRGCPYNCLFCHRPHLGKKFRARSAVNVVNEIKACVEMGINEILIYDDTFTVDRQRVIEICSLIITKKIKVAWDIRARVDNIDMEMLKFLKGAGCKRIHYGVESANAEVLKMLRKGITLAQVELAFKMTKEVGIDTLAYFMIGSPGETKEQIMNTISYARKLQPDYCHFSITTPFPGTPLYQMGLEQGIFEDYWKEFAMNPTVGFVPEIWNGKLGRKELEELLDYAYKSFYTRPSYMLKQLTKIHSFGEFTRKAKAGLRVVSG